MRTPEGGGQEEDDDITLEKLRESADLQHPPDLPLFRSQRRTVHILFVA